jgi:double-stranded uracil-DNA glycosylase
VTGTGGGLAEALLTLTGLAMPTAALKRVAKLNGTGRLTSKWSVAGEGIWGRVGQADRASAGDLKTSIIDDRVVRNWKGNLDQPPRKKQVLQPAWAGLRLKDRIRQDLGVLFVGINPGVRSAMTGHHFAGYSNRFWKLLSESRLVPEPITYRDDHRLLEWNLGITNLIARPSPGMDDLRPAEYVEGWKVLEKKIRRYRPAVVALVGVTLYRSILPLLHATTPAGKGRPALSSARGKRAGFVGPQPVTIHGARVFVLPNPSGRNANFSYAEMLEAYVRLRRWSETLSRQS